MHEQQTVDNLPGMLTASHSEPQTQSLPSLSLEFPKGEKKKEPLSGRSQSAAESSTTPKGSSVNGPRRAHSRAVQCSGEHESRKPFQAHLLQAPGHRVPMNGQTHLPSDGGTSKSKDLLRL